MSSWRQRQQQSEVVGGGPARHGSTFRALQPLVCDWCHAAISIGEEFTRSSRGPLHDASWGRLLRNVCRRCGRHSAGPPGTPGQGAG